MPRCGSTKSLSASIKYEEEGPDPDETMSPEDRIAQWRTIIENTEKCYQWSLSDG